METNYKTYISSMKSTMTGIDPNIKEITITGWMQDIAVKFPYYKHTNPNAMAIAMYLAQKNSEVFNRSEAMGYILRTSFNYVGKKDVSHVIVDVARYWKGLTSPREIMV